VLVLLVAAAVAVPASAAQIQPGSLVLRPSDVPARMGFRVDRSQTGVRTNEREARQQPRVGPLFERWGRVTGYQLELERDRDVIGARVDVFRNARGADRMLAWYDRELRRGGIGGLRRRAMALGDRAYLYGGRSPAAFTLVVWREGRVLAILAGIGIPQRTTLQLARTQERRIAAGLR